MTASPRKYVDCGQYPSDNNCSLKISGTEDEVLTAATQHATTSHGHQDGPELRDWLRSAMRDEGT